jgi:site-specific DNA-methyltransferase (adenine-specific)
MERNQTAADHLRLHLGDCLEVMRSLPANSVDLICTDPPYFKVKSAWWDRQWDSPKKFLEWLDSIAEQWQRILKPNGSLYCFASPKMSARVEVMLGERFNVVNRITWNKGDLPTGGRHTSACKETLRGFFPASESIIFCEHYGADNIAKGEAGYGAKCDELRGFVFEPLRAYLDGERRRLGLSSTPFDELLGTNALCKKYFNTCQWQLPTEDGYRAFQQAFPGYFTRPYEELREQYEELRRPFSVTADVPYTDVWTFPTVSSYPGKHPCEKPSAMLEHIISASSRPGAVVLDCFAGSGSTLVAAKKLRRQWIGIEIDPHWVAIARQRLGRFDHSWTLEERVARLEFQTRAIASKVRRIDQRQQLSLFG